MATNFRRFWPQQRQRCLKQNRKPNPRGTPLSRVLTSSWLKPREKGDLRVLSAEDPNVIKATAEAFQKRYPFINVRAEGIEGTEVYLRVLEEMRSGFAKWM
jgi:hypothetical protein